MASVDDVAALIIERLGPLDTFKLQKLVYYSQAWNLVWDGRPLFDARIEAWANGPVVPKLYQRHRGRYKVSAWPWGDSSRLTQDEEETVDAVLDTYGALPGYQLAELTHREDPWRDARATAGLGAGDRGGVRITNAAMAEYYGGLID